MIQARFSHGFAKKQLFFSVRYKNSKFLYLLLFWLKCTEKEHIYIKLYFGLLECLKDGK